MPTSAKDRSFHQTSTNWNRAPRCTEGKHRHLLLAAITTPSPVFRTDRNITLFSPYHYAIAYVKVTLIPFPRRDFTSSGAHFRAQRGQTKPLAGHAEEGNVDGIALQAQRHQCWQFLALDTTDNWPKKCSKGLFKHSNNQLVISLPIKIFLKRSYPVFTFLME